LQIDIVPVDSGKFFVGICNVNRLGVVQKSVENGFTLVIDNRNAAEDLPDIGLHHFAVNGDFLGKEVIVWAYWFRDLFDSVCISPSLILRFRISIDVLKFGKCPIGSGKSTVQVYV
jgi:hypothetical protein